MTLTLGVLIVLAIIPVGLALIFTLGSSFSLRLAIWFSAGFLMSQWMHVMIFVFKDHLIKNSQTTRLNFLYFYHVKWSNVLTAGVIISSILAITLYLLCSDLERLNIKYLITVLAVSLAISQLCGSSIPKFGGEFSMAIFFFLGIFVQKYFLTYSIGSTPPSHQVQSDALTSFGLLIAAISIWFPFVLGFAEFLFSRYFASESPMLQFQLTRYAAYVAWNLVLIGMVAWRCLQLLVEARRGIT